MPDKIKNTLTLDYQEKAILTAALASYKKVFMPLSELQISNDIISAVEKLEARVKDLDSGFHDS